MLYIVTNLEILKTSSYQRQINNTRKDLRLRESLKKMLIEYKMDIQKIKFKSYLKNIDKVKMIYVICLIYKSKLYMKNCTKQKWEFYAVFMLTTKCISSEYCNNFLVSRIITKNISMNSKSANRGTMWKTKNVNYREQRERIIKK